MNADEARYHITQNAQHALGLFDAGEPHDASTIVEMTRKVLCYHTNLEANDISGMTLWHCPDCKGTTYG